MKNWKTIDEANEMKCPAGHTYACEKCNGWFWRPCDACDTGTVINRDGDVLKHVPCQVCNGTGHDGSGLGRCGLIRG
jgi:hypothetical protein